MQEPENEVLYSIMFVPTVRLVRPENVRRLQAGDKVYRFEWEPGSDWHDYAVEVFDVRRANEKSVTVRTADGRTRFLRYDMIDPS